MSFPGLAAVKASYSMLMDGQTEAVCSSPLVLALIPNTSNVQLAQTLQRLIRSLHHQLSQLQQQLHLDPGSENLLRVSDDCPQSPIFSVLTAEPRSLAAYCQGKGIIIRAIVPPTVPAGSERVRVCLHAGNTEAQVEKLVETMKEWVALARRQASSDPRELSAQERARL